MKKQILFQAYGNDGIVAECKFALLRLATLYPSKKLLPEVVVYTDQPQAFTIFEKSLSLHIIEIDTAQIALWKGKINFVHRVKIEVIKDCLHRFGGKVLYTDTDTFCLQNLENLFDRIAVREVVMYEKEGVLSQPINLHFKKWKNFLRKNIVGSIGTMPLINTTMWNAGVIGLQQNHLPLLENVLSTTDHLYPLFPRHTVEQLAFCYTFQNEGFQIVSAQPYFFHYWNLKEFRTLLLAFFAKYEQQSFYDLVTAATRLQPGKIVASKLQFKKKPSLLRAFIKLTGKQWTIDPFMPND